MTFSRKAQIAVAATDMVAILVASMLAAQMRLGMWYGSGMENYYAMTFVLCAVTFFSAWGHGIYRETSWVSSRILLAGSYGVFLTILLSYLLGGSPIVSRQWLLTTWLGSSVLLLSFRVCAKNLVRVFRVRQDRVFRVLIVGANPRGVALAKDLEQTNKGSFVVGFLDDYLRPGSEPLPKIKVIGHPQDLKEIAGKENVDEVVLISGALSWESERVMAETAVLSANQWETRIAPSFSELLSNSSEIAYRGHLPLFTVHPLRLRGFNIWWKTIVEFTISGSIGLFLSPLWAGVFLKSKLYGVNFLHEELVQGVGGKNFAFLSFGPEVVSSNSVLRRLPALLNVLKGQMSLVGPTPMPVTDAVEFHQMRPDIVTMRPGLTGLWRFHEDKIGFSERATIDLAYVRNYSIFLDIKIMMQTITLVWLRWLRSDESLSRWMPAED
tara:strand:- start:15706 stop:17022 length:1317 start_codon:yes stop_codon:yes gene_type:complete